MALARQQADWSRTAVAISWHVAAFSGKRIDPRKIIPPQFQPKARTSGGRSSKSPEQKKHESKRAWQLMHKWSGGGAPLKIQAQPKHQKEKK